MKRSESRLTWRAGYHRLKIQKKKKTKMPNPERVFFFLLTGHWRVLDELTRLKTHGNVMST